MTIQIKPLGNKDFSKAIDFAISGMNFDQYLESKWMQQAYGRYFLYLEMQRATDILAAYEGEQLLGLVMMDMVGESKPYQSFWRGLYVKLVDVVQTFFAGAVGPYNRVNKEMLSHLQETQQLDGELCFLAADPQIKGKGIGSHLLKALEDKYAGKTIYLFTDENCTYQFYDKRGFERVGEKVVEMDLGKTKQQMTCFLYQKTL